MDVWERASIESRFARCQIGFGQQLLHQKQKKLRHRDPPLSLPRKSSENLEKVPRIWEGEGYWRSEILNPINNDYWVDPSTGLDGATECLESPPL